MENKLNKQSLDKYSTLIAKTLCDEYFTKDTTYINGKSILTFTALEQVNYFILKNLFFQWKVETDNLKKSPYFNYDSESITAALQNLMNELSNHILVKRSHFEPLLRDAVEETLYLALSPYHYFKQYFFYPEKIKISVTELKEMSKYIKINSTFYEEFIRKVESYRMESFVVSDILGYFQQAYYNNNDFDSYENITEQLSKIVPLNLNEIVIDPKKKNDYAPTPLELFEAKQKPAEPAKTLATNNIKPIRLSINQRIMFQRELFNNDADQMEHTLARLESAGTLDNAQYILGFFNWDKENEAVQEFHELIEAKYR